MSLEWETTIVTLILEVISNKDQRIDSKKSIHNDLKHNMKRKHQQYIL